MSRKSMLGILWTLLIILLASCSEKSQESEELKENSEHYSVPSEVSDPNFLQDPNQIAYGSYFLVRNSCLACHKITGLENKPKSFAPSLDNIGNKVHSEWIELWLENPKKYSENSKMPRFFLEEDETTALTQYLMSLKDSEPKVPAKTKTTERNPNPKVGKAIFQNSGCIQCHIRGSNEEFEEFMGVSGGSLGPDLTNLSQKLQKDWLLAFLEDPKKFYPNTLMPTYNFSQQERSDLVSYLLEGGKPSSIQKTTQKTTDPKPVKNLADSFVEKSLVEKGKTLFQERSCLQCHAVRGETPLESFVDLSFIQDRDPESIYPSKRASSSTSSTSGSLVESLTLEESLFLKLKDSHPSPLFRMPQYNLSDRQILSILAYLLNQKDFKQEVARNETNKKAWTLSDHWELPIPLQSRAPDEYSLQESSLDPKSCGLCHQEQYRDWKESRHAKAMGPGVIGQFLELNDPNFTASCKLCHAPLSEQNEVLDFWNGSEWDYRKNFSFDSDLAQTAINCAVCHVRSHQRFSSVTELNESELSELKKSIKENNFSPSPSSSASSSEPSFTSSSPSSLPSPNTSSNVSSSSNSDDSPSSFTSTILPDRFSDPNWIQFSRFPHGSAEGKKEFSESKFCAVCHQFSSEGLQGQVLNGKPLENTFNEWRASSWAKRGISCQDCHMPEKRHQWKGIHDPDFVRSAIRLEVKLVKITKNKQKNQVHAKIELFNEGSGHHFPTYATPKVFLIAELMDSQNQSILQTRKKDLIQRALNSTLTEELFDTRIPSGNSHQFLYQVSRPAHAKTLRVQVIVSPDFFYQGFFQKNLPLLKNPRAKTLYRSALKDIQETDYILYQKEIPLK